jgi:flagellar biogenesis protein FliO
MGGYLTGFIVYTAAMIGVIFIAVFAYSKFSFKGSSKSKFLNVEDCISLAPRKNLYVIRAGNEKFLVASDAERTNLISKLNESSKQMYSQQDKQEMSSEIDELPVIVDFSSMKKEDRKSKKIFKNIVNNI